MWLANASRTTKIEGTQANLSCQQLCRVRVKPGLVLTLITGADSDLPAQVPLDRHRSTQTEVRPPARAAQPLELTALDLLFVR